MDEGRYIAVIGGANIDIIGSVSGTVIPEDSNPGRIHLCPGGVGRNIAENLARLSAGVKLISTLGDDIFGHLIAQQTEAAGVDMSCCHIVKGSASSAYMAILDSNGEMKLALSDMHIADELPIEVLERHRRMIEGAELIVLDANLPGTAISHIFDSFTVKHAIIDPVSIGKAKRIKYRTGSFDTLKLNRMEAEFLSGIPIKIDDDLRRAGEIFMQKGSRRVFITLGSEGVFYQSASESGICESPYITPVNATGAGDAFTAGAAYCTMHGYDIRYTAQFACAMARISLMSLSAVSPEISVEYVSEKMGEFL